MIWIRFLAGLDTFLSFSFIIRFFGSSGTILALILLDEYVFDEYTFSTNVDEISLGVHKWHVLPIPCCLIIPSAYTRTLCVDELSALSWLGYMRSLR